MTSGRRGARLVELEQERNFLLDSIKDLERERSAGDLDAHDYEELRSDYVRRAAAVLRSIEEIETDASLPVASSEPATTRWRTFRHALGRRRVRLMLGVGSTVCLLAAAGLFAAHVAGVRLPGQSVTGSISMNQAALVAEDLSKAAIEANSGSVSNAILLYEAVLAKVPDQQVALTYGGWLTRLSGLSARDAAAVREGDADLASAARAHPDYADGEGLYGVVLYEDAHAPKAAVAAFSRCLSDGPAPTLIKGIAPVARLAYAATNLTVPMAYARA